MIGQHGLGELTALHVEPVEGGDDGVSVNCLTEISEGEPAELARLVEVVVERVRRRNGQRRLSIKSEERS